MKRLHTRTEFKYMRRICACCCLLLAVVALPAQGVFPVQISGILIPPRSLDLAVYTSQRPTDLVFTATLLDPVEPFRDIRLKVTIESNNRIIYITDPNAAVPVIRIYKDQPEVFNGFALQPYLQPAALTGATGEGTGAVILPEGYDRILVEVIDVQRNVPISRQAAVGGNFILNDPPFTTLPVNGAQFRYPVTQNLIFHWTPRHIGSLNPPGGVEYVFKIVEVSAGVADPNDGFDNNLTVYQTTSFIPTVNYSVSEPHLEPGKLYAWRVQARSVTAPGLYFRNYGYSTVSTFSFTTDGTEGDRGPGGNEEGRTPPNGCVTFDTDFGPVSSVNIIPALLTAGDAVKLGWFNLEIGSVTPSGEGYSGSGTISVPFLASRIKVTFSKLKVKEGNIDKRVYSAASVYAVVEEAFAYDPLLLSEKNLDSVFTESYLTGLESFFATGAGQKHTLSRFDPQSPPLLALPIGIDRPVDSLPQPMVMITGIRFTPRNAFLTCVAAICSSDNTLLRYAAFEVPCTPYGIQTKSRLSLLRELNTAIDRGFTLKTNGGAEGKGMGITCEGFRDYDLDAVVTVKPALVRSAGGAPLQVHLLKETGDPAAYQGDTREIGDFVAPQLPGFVFSAKKGTLDFDQAQPSSPGSPDTLFNAIRDADWRGLYLDAVRVKLPPEYDFTPGKQRIAIDKGALAVQENGITGLFRKTDVVSVHAGKLGPWGFGVDTLELTIDGAKNSRLALSGPIWLPLFDVPVLYRAQAQAPSSGAPMLVKPAPGSYQMPMWNGVFDINDSTVVTATLEETKGERRFSLQAVFSGQFLAGIDAATFEQYLEGDKTAILTQLKQLLGVSTISLQLDSARINGLGIHPGNPPGQRYSLASAHAETINIGGKSFRVGELDLLQEPESKRKPQALGLKIVAYREGGLVQFVLWAQADKKGVFHFHRISVDTEHITCRCSKE